MLEQGCDSGAGQYSRKVKTFPCERAKRRQCDYSSVLVDVAESRASQSAHHARGDEKSDLSYASLLKSDAPSPRIPPGRA